MPRVAAAGYSRNREGRYVRRLQGDPYSVHRNCSNQYDRARNH